MTEEFQPEEAFARRLDERDPLAGYRARFHLPRGPDGTPLVYFAGNSLGLQPVGAAAAVEQELADWARLGVDAHFAGRTPWYAYHEVVRDSLARLVGARPTEVVAMNGLTVNLHLMFVSFYRPTPERNKILMEEAAFPSDTYAVKSQLRLHGYDPADGLVVAPQTELVAVLEERGRELALVLLPGANYYTGQAFDLPRLAALARARGAVVGLDLAHAAGNLPLALHDWDVDFAVWCNYKYLNAGPGAVAGCFVHERHVRRRDLPRLAGWWGHDPERRFRMHLEQEFEPVPSADGWQLSNPPILALAPLRASLELFDAAGMPALREKSERLTAYLGSWIDRAGGRFVEQLTPRDPGSRGCQLSLRVLERAEELHATLRSAGVVGDFRRPDVVRIAPVPLYNTFHEVWRFGQVLTSWARRG